MVVWSDITDKLKEHVSLFSLMYGLYVWEMLVIVNYP